MKVMALADARAAAAGPAVNAALHAAGVQPAPAAALCLLHRVAAGHSGRARALPWTECCPASCCKGPRCSSSAATGSPNGPAAAAAAASSACTRRSSAAKRASEGSRPARSTAGAPHAGNKRCGNRWDAGSPACAATAVSSAATWSYPASAGCACKSPRPLNAGERSACSDLGKE